MLFRSQSCRCVSILGKYAKVAWSLFLTENKISRLFSRRKIFIVVMNSSTHINCIDYFYCSQLGNLVYNLSVTVWVKRNFHVFASGRSLCSISRDKLSSNNFLGRNSFLSGKFFAFSLVTDSSIHRQIKRPHYILFLFPSILAELVTFNWPCTIYNISEYDVWLFISYGIFFFLLNPYR